MRSGEVNAEWHDAHGMPQNPTRAQRVEWHAEHELACGCRPVPASLTPDVKAFNKKRSARRSN
jgi:hypothetical protein